MGGNRRDDGYGIDGGRGKDIPCIAGDLDMWVQSRDALQRFRALIANRDDFAVGEPVKVPDHVRAPIAVANNTNAEHAFYSLVPGSYKLDAFSRAIIVGEV